MGFFYQERAKGVTPKAERPARESKVKGVTRTKALPRTIPLVPVGPLGCAQCTLDKETLRTPKMPASGSQQPLLYFIGIAPGPDEDELGRHFVSRDGQLIRNRIPAKLEPRIRWNNAVNCRPPADREASEQELECCRSRLEDDIARTKPRAVVTFGRIPLHHVIGGIKKISDWRGRRMLLRVKDHSCWLYAIEDPAFVKRMERNQKEGPAILAAFDRDLQRVFNDASQGLMEAYCEDPAVYKDNIEIVTEHTDTSIARIADHLTQMCELEDVTIDIETHKARPYEEGAKILSFAVGTYEKVLVWGYEHPQCTWSASQKEQLKTIFFQFVMESKRKWAHFEKFEAEWLTWLLGPEILFETEWRDTGALAHTVDERAGKKLGDLTQIYMGFRVKDIMQVDTARLIEYPLETVLVYNGLDVKYTDPIRVMLLDEVARQGLDEVATRFDAMVPSLVMMQRKGVTRDVKEIESHYTALTKEKERISYAIANHGDVKRFITQNGKFLPSSHGPNGDLIKFFRDFIKAEGGWVNKRANKYSVDEDHLLQISHPVAKWILELRKVDKLRGTYVIPLLDKKRALELAAEERDEKLAKKLRDDGGSQVHADGLLHADFGHLVTVTTRLACSDPNLQNFPSRDPKAKLIRKVIVPPPGHKLVAADFGQLEARTIAFVSQDPVLKAETWRNDDIHGVWTDKLGGKFVPEKLKDPKLRKMLRNEIKNTWTFPLFFGNVLEAVAHDVCKAMGLELSRTEMKYMVDRIAPFFDEFWDKYPRVKQWQEELLDFYWQHRYCETLMGFRRREPMPRNEIINHPIQGTAAQIVLDAQIRLARMAYEQDRPWLQPVMNIHDDLTFFIPDEKLEDAIETIAREMCCCPFPFIDVPLLVEVSVGNNWAEKEEIGKFFSTDFDPNYGKRQ